MKTLIMVCMLLVVSTWVFAESVSGVTNHIDVLSATDFGYCVNGMYQDAMRVTSINKIALNLKWFGIAGDYRYNWSRFDDYIIADDYDESSYGVGAGLPHPDIFRLFGSYHILRYANPWLDETSDASWMEFEMAKRIHSENMFSELSACYRLYDFSVPYENYPNLLPNPLLVPALLDQTPDKDIEIKASVSSVTETWQEPVSGCGIALEEYPLHMINDVALAFIVEFRYTEARDDAEVMQFQAKLPMNLSQYFGLDLAYTFTKTDQDDVLSKSNQASVQLRPVFIASDAFRLSGLCGFEMNNTKDEQKLDPTQYFLNYGAIASLQIKNHVSLYARYLSKNWWDLKNDASNVDEWHSLVNAGLVLRF